MTDYSQRIFYDSGSSRFGWDWRWPYNPSQVRGYPEVIYGKKPWNASSTVAHLPCPILDANLEVEFDLSTEATGVYNTAFDIWLTGTKEARPEDILFEIMIWIDNHGMRPLGSVRDTVEIGGMRYDVWVSKRVGEYGWTYICFKAVTLSDRQDRPWRYHALSGHRRGWLRIRCFSQTWSLKRDHLWVGERRSCPLTDRER